MVFTSGQMYVSGEFAREPLAWSSDGEPIPSGWGGACIPIRSEAEVIGVLSVSVPLPRQITPEELKLLESLADMAGSALQRLRLHEEALRRINQLQALESVNRAITASLDLRLSLNILLENTLSQLGADSAGVLLYNPTTMKLDYAAGRGFNTRAYELSNVRLGEGQVSHAVFKRHTIHVIDISDCDPPFTRLPALAREGFVSYTATPLLAKGQLKGVMEVFHRNPFKPDKEWLGLFEALARLAAIAIDNAQLFEDLQRSNLELTLAYDATIEGWSRALELRDIETAGHAQRVADLTVELAQAMGISKSDIIHIRRGALLHDIGKMGIQDSILHKPGPLTDEEWAVMHKHPQVAYEMLSSIAYLRPALDIPYCHHEKWDGTGYPRGLKGEEIPLPARIFAVVDVYDALTSARPYRPAWTKAQALDYIREQAGKHLDPQVVEVFLRLIGERMLGAI